MSLVKIRLDGELFEIDKLTLGEGRVLKRDFGMTDLSQFNLSDPDQMVGMLAIATKRKHTDWTDVQIMAHVEGLDFLSIEHVEEDVEPADDPTRAATENADGGEHLTNGSPETIRETPGLPS